MKAILLVPASGDPHQLLAPGICGDVPPKAWRHWHSGRWLCLNDRMTSTEFVKLDQGEQDPQEALVLAWDGKPVPEGCDHAVRTYNRVAKDGVLGIQDEYDLDFALFIAKANAAHAIGKVVVIE